MVQKKKKRPNNQDQHAMKKNPRKVTKSITFLEFKAPVESMPRRKGSFLLNREQTAQPQQAKNTVTTSSTFTKKDSTKSKVTEVVKKSTSKFNITKLVEEGKGGLRDRYKEQNQIGKGANGKVKLIYDTVTNEMRAMKIIPKEICQRNAKNINSEIEVLKKLDHINIIKLFEFYQDEHNYYLITEYCAGRELFDRIVKMKHFSESDAAGIMKQILSAISYCHKRKIVHRYISPLYF